MMMDDLDLGPARPSSISESASEDKPDDFPRFYPNCRSSIDFSWTPPAMPSYPVADVGFFGMPLPPAPWHHTKASAGRFTPQIAYRAAAENRVDEANEASRLRRAGDRELRRRLERGPNDRGYVHEAIPFLVGGQAAADLIKAAAAHQELNVRLQAMADAGAELAELLEASRDDLGVARPFVVRLGGSAVTSDELRNIQAAYGSIDKPVTSDELRRIQARGASIDKPDDAAGRIDP